MGVFDNLHREYIVCNGKIDEKPYFVGIVIGKVHDFELH
jgi:hypothetical protein